MKRGVLFFIIFFCVACLFSQNKYKLYWTLDIPNQDCNCRDGGIKELIIKSSSNIKYLYAENNQLWSAFGETHRGTVEMYLGNTITFEIRTSSNIKNAQRDCSSEYIRTFNVEDIICPSKTFTPRAIKKKTFQADATCFELSFTFDHAEPIIDLIQPNNVIIGYDDPFNISVAGNSKGFSDSSYNWQYHVEGDQVWVERPFGVGRWVDVWQNLPAWTQGENSFDITPNTFLGKEDINKEIRFRIKSCQGYISNDNIFYNLRKSAPKILYSEVSPPKCYNSKGSVKLFFNRQLDLGEKISYVISDKTKSAGSTGGVPYYTPLFTKDNLEIFEQENGRFFIEIGELDPSDSYFYEMIGFGEDTDYRGEDGGPFDIEDSQFKGKSYFTDGQDHSTNIAIIRPTPVDFSMTSSTDVKCYGERNGSISIEASGGNVNGTYQYQLFKDGNLFRDWTSFSSVNTSMISGLSIGSYIVKVQDANNCISREIERDNSGSIIGLGDEKEIEQTINEPLPLTTTIVDNEIQEPTAYGFTDGVVSVEIVGGNHNNTGYNVAWYKNENLISNPTIERTTSGTEASFIYIERFLGVGEGKYRAVITDDNGCTTSIEYDLGQPDPLEVFITVENPISCNDGNTESLTKIEDGVLKAVASGGVGNYTYTWKWRESTNDSWTILTSPPSIENESVFKDLGKGQYAVNVKDDNGIELGIYTDNDLSSIVRKDSLFILNEPEPIVIVADSQSVLCKNGNNGWIDVSVSGGTLKNGENYRYEWSNGKIGSKIENLTAGTYGIYVYDSNDCYAYKEFNITEPLEELQLAIVGYKQPKATGLTDGYIQYKVTGGTPNLNKTYNYNWTDGDGVNLNSKVTDSLASNGYFIKLNNIGKGDYYLTVTDANYVKTTSNIACTAKEEFKMDEPDPLELIISETKVISCNTLNEYGNPFSDGALTASAKGGVILQPNENRGLPYFYTWKKKNIDGTWKVLTNQTDSIATNLNAGEYAVNIEDANGVVLGTYGINNELEQEIDILYTLEEPPLLEIATIQQNVYCFAGSDGWAEVRITGGTAPYIIKWSNEDTTARATGLSAGNYEVYVTDSRGCEAIAHVNITEPERPVSISYSKHNRPTSIGANDAWIEAVISGGTPFVDGTYTYYWENKDGTSLIAQTSTEIINNTYVVRLNNISAGTYYLTVQDKNHEIATTKQGCTHANSDFIIYEPIEAIIEIEIPISCNADNEYQDPYSDGALVAHIQGGVPFESGLPYIYHWKKQKEDGQWEDLIDQLDSIAIDLNDGNYALNVEDSKGTVMGTYTSDDLISAIDSTYYFKEPDLLELAFSSTEISCDAGNNGTAQVFISGGVAPYDIKWSNGETTSKINNLIGGSYFVFVTDSRGCEVSGNIEVSQPGGLQLDVAVQKNPTCYEGDDGEIAINVAGGIAPYQYQWNTGETINRLSNLMQGTYTLKIIDSEGCVAFKEIILEDPDPVFIDLGEDRTLCNGQEYTLDISIEDPGASYYWESDNGYNSTNAKVSLNKAGTYTATITTSLGCIGTDQIVIQESDVAIDADFLITSQAFVNEEVVLVNVSSPLGEATEWNVPDGVSIVSESNEAIILKFNKVGMYDVRLRTMEGDCFQDYNKQIIVEEPIDLVGIGDAEQPFLKKFMVYPNPSDGNFQVEIELEESADVALRIISLLTADVSSTRTMNNKNNYLESYNTALASGTYILLLETPKGNEVRRIVIK
ncbi:T9SS type A sorting domain-containing protein [Joostella sp.]|uniref:T9SS type A sorting domain-containing protein n=1 Tax=Joostella sp. TaxID=2231138 RepID=UPI003A8EF824